VSQFPLTIAHGMGQAEPRIAEYTFLSTDTSQPGDLVFLDTADNNVKKCGANPASILGICMGYAPAATQLTGGGMKPEPYGTNKVPVAVLTGDITVEMSSLVTPAVSFLARSQDIANVTPAGPGITSFWQLLSTTANTRVRVIDINIGQGIFYVRFLDANLQALVS
jgi:hypothetical protein